jgi:hypothetical protein
LAARLDAIAERLFAGVMAPLVLGGAIRPCHAIGARAALALGEGRLPADRELGARVDAARLRRARRLVPVDAVPDPAAADWALASALNDLLQSANPEFDRALRRRAAARILELAAAAIDRVPPPATLAEAIARHTWLGRAPQVTRTDTSVRWWTGHAEFLGVEQSPRLQAWPQLRRVEVVRTPVPVLELSPLAVERARLTDAVAALLTRTPLTDLATCTRDSPAFVWHSPALNLVATAPGRTLAMRALARLAPAEADAALGRATRSLLSAGLRNVATPALSLLAERALAAADRRLDSMASQGGSIPDDRSAAGGAQSATSTDAIFARALGAVLARRALRAGEGAWPDGVRLGLIQALATAAQSPVAREATSLLEPTPSPAGEARTP